MRTLTACLMSLVLVAACGGDDEATPTDAPVADAGPDGPPIDAAIDAGFVPPTMLSETGLYSDIGTKTVAADVHEFMPRWQLWSDDAVKRRWIWLPPGAKIDTTDMDYWHFPVGTKLWKEFVRGGRRVETRLLEKIGPTDDWADWYAVSFQWDVGETDGAAVPAGVIDDVGHDDIPGRSDCRKCHVDTRIASVAIGFSALLLDDPAVPGYKLADLIADDRLTAPPTNPTAGAYFPLPAGDTERAALGYLHVNCGNCHNAGSDVVAQITPMQLRQSVGALTDWTTTAPYLTTVNVVGQLNTVGATALITPGAPGTSAVLVRLRAVPPGQVMPPVGRETIDPIGAEAVRAWIAGL
ncbi:MAG: hypothetical protein IPL61_16830 [Myxococcales bacterium]|nr:hypothetical protein [Myxococcales bacterium]